MRIFTLSFLVIMLLLTYSGQGKSIAAWNNRGLVLTENKGQITDQCGAPRNDIQYYITTGKFNIFIGNNAIHYQWNVDDSRLDNTTAFAHDINTYRLDMRLQNANPDVQVIAEDIAGGSVQYYNAGKSLTASSFRKITYKEVYPDIDWVIYIKDNKLEYDFVVRPGGMVSDIQMRYNGADAIAATATGSMKVTTAYGSVTEQQPYALAGGREVPVFFKQTGNSIGFEVGKYHGTLTIDPVLEWSTYFGGDGNDVVNAIELEKGDAHLYVCGSAASTNTIATTGAHQQTLGGRSDIFLAKFDEDGVLQWATYYGGSRNDYGNALAFDAIGNVYVAGTTFSPGIATPGVHQEMFLGGAGYSNSQDTLADAILIKFDANGIRQWATYYGGGGYYGKISYVVNGVTVIDSIWHMAGGTETGFAVTCDANNNVYMAGITGSDMDYMSTIGAHQRQPSANIQWGLEAYIVKFNSTGSRVWGTFYGGMGDDGIFAMRCDNGTDLYVAGYTTSQDSISTNGTQISSGASGMYDNFVARFNTNGQRIWGTYIGGRENEGKKGALATDKAGDIYLAGSTESIDSFGTAGVFRESIAGLYDGYLIKVNDAGQQQWSTYYGGAKDESVNAIAADANGYLYVAGATYSDTGIATSNGYQDTIGGRSTIFEDAFITCFNANGQRQWGTYFGNNQTEIANAISVSAIGALYIAGLTGSDTGLATPGAHQMRKTKAPLFLGGADGFIAKFLSDVDLAIEDVILTDTICVGRADVKAVIKNHSSFPLQDTVTVVLVAMPGDQSLQTTKTIKLNVEATETLLLGALSFSTPGIYNITAYVYGVDRDTLQINDTLTTQIVVKGKPDISGIAYTQDDHVFDFQPNEIKYKEDVRTYLWSFGDNTAINNEEAPQHTYEREDAYTVTLTVDNGYCTDTAAQRVCIFNVALTASTEEGEVNEPVTLTSSAIVPYSVLAWNPAALFADQQAKQQTVLIDTLQRYQVIAISEAGCTDSAWVAVRGKTYVAMPNAFTPNGDGKNDVFRPVSRTGRMRAMTFGIYSRWGQKLFETKDTTQGWDGTYKGQPLDVGVYYYTITATTFEGDEFYYKGDFTLIR